MKIVFFGTSNVALPILEKLHQHHDIVAVVTQPDAAVGRKQELTESPVSVLANEMGLKIFKPQNLKGNQEFIESLKQLQADVFIVVSYGKILPSEIISLPLHKTLNVHFSLLPKYRGASPIQAALLHGEQQTGTSIMLVDEQLDRGPILAQEKYPIDPDDNFVTLSEKLATVSAKLLFDTLPRYTSGELKPMPQDESQASYTKIITKDDGKIDWSKSATEIYNQFRAFYPWPGIWTTWNGKKIKITDCVATNLQMENESTNAYKCGQLLENGIVVCGQNTFLQINALQLEGKNEIDIKSFLNGYKEFLGSQLE